MKVLQISLSVLGGEVGDVPLRCLVLGTRWVLVGDVWWNVRVAASLQGAREGQLLRCRNKAGVLGVGRPLVVPFLKKRRGGALVLHGVQGLRLLQWLDVLGAMSVD